MSSATASGSKTPILDMLLGDRKTTILDTPMVSSTTVVRAGALEEPREERSMAGRRKATVPASEKYPGQAALQVTADRLSSHRGFSLLRHQVFTLAEAGMYTVKGKFKGGEYKKSAFMGGEQLTLHSVYGGTKDLIFVFKPSDPWDNIDAIEVPMAQIGKVKDLENALSAMLGVRLSVFVQANEAELAVEEERLESERVAEQYGSRWGTFA